MILTLTANPSVDRTVELGSALVRGEVNRAFTVTSQAGGKGVNISRAATQAGVPTIAVLPADADDPFVLRLRADGIDARPERPSGPIRSNVTLTEPDGTTTKINSPGALATPDMLRGLRDSLAHRAVHADWVVLAGSLPPGAPRDWYAEVVLAVRAAAPDAQIAVDTADDALLGLTSRLPEAAPDLMKPNAEELATLVTVLGGEVGADVAADPVAAATAARVLVGRGVGAVLATLGPNGAVLVTATGAWHAVPPPTAVVSTVGAGDSSLFGYLLAERQGAAAADRLRSAVAWGSAAAALPGTTIPGPDDPRPDLVTLEELSLPDMKEQA